MGKSIWKKKFKKTVILSSLNHTAKIYWGLAHRGFYPSTTTKQFFKEKNVYYII